MEQKRDDGGGGGGQAELYSFDFDHLVYAMNWSLRPDPQFRLAVGSFTESINNQVQLVHLDGELDKFVCDPRYTFEHPYPPTKLAFIPDSDGSKPDLIATSGDNLRIWKVVEGSGVTLERLLNTASKSSDFCAPLTSFDWSDVEPTRIGTASIDTTCTIWDIERGVPDTQLIAHDREVYDIAWGGPGVFGSVSADGSVRVFDLRDKSNSTIIYESPKQEPLLRLGWNKQDPRYMATIVMSSPKVIILDIRFPTFPLFELQRHTAPVNALAWAPHSASHICTVGDDCQALIWDLASLSRTEQGLDPMLQYPAQQEINQLQWSPTHYTWVAIGYGKTLQVLRV